MKTKTKLPMVTSAGVAAAAFWLVWLAISLTFLISYWMSEPRLALTAVLGLVIWACTAVLWGWRLVEEDDKAADLAVEEERQWNPDRYFDPATERKSSNMRRKRLRLRRRRFVIFPILALEVVAMFALFIAAIWSEHGHPFSVTAVIMLACSVPLVLVTVED